MKKIDKINFVVILVLIFFLKDIKVFSQPNSEVVKFAVCFHNENDPYIQQMKRLLQKIQGNNQRKVEFVFYNGESNQELQNTQLENAISNNADVLVVNIVDFDSASPLVNRAKEHNLPIIFFDREPSDLSPLQSYGKSIFIGTSGCESGMIKAHMIINQIKNNSIIDRNNNNQLDYIMIKGEEKRKDSIGRSRCVIDELNKNEIKTNEIYSSYFN